MPVLRTLLFAPATQTRHVTKALSGVADGTILDLEDAVAHAEKATARLAARHALAARGASAAGPLAYVRINGLTTPYAYEDLCAVVGPWLDGIVLPKVESAAQVATVDWLLLQLERAQGMSARQIDLIPIIETAAGLAQLNAIATASPRVRRFVFGAVDFSLDTNMVWTADHEGLLWVRIQVVIAARAAGLEPPIDTVYPRLDDMEGFGRETEQAKRLGFQGKVCIHPRQVEVANAIFTPTTAEVAAARRIVEAFAAAEGAGIASLQLDGQFIDYPVAERARRIVDIAEQIARAQR
jgi:citrate lyase subunit beta/citryl-CoA lyase